MRLVAVLLALGLTASTSGPLPPEPSESSTTRPRTPAMTPFALVSEVNGDGAELIGRRLRDGLANGASLHPVLSPGERDIATTEGVPFVYFSVPVEAGVGSCYPETADQDAARTLEALGVTAESDAWRLGMPEFDQGGGCWARGRPSPAGMTNEQAYDMWSRFYLDTKGLRSYLEPTAEERGYKWMAVCAYGFCPQYAFDLGSDAVLLERNNDEVSGLSPGIAMIRGAARQNGGREWGIDLSTYRYWNGGPTTFDADGRLATGWSPSMFERHMYAAYMSGAPLILNEAADYSTGATAGGLNPLGLVVREFADFSLRRHPDRGTPHVPIALLQDHLSGFEPRFGEFEQAPQKWYRRNPYTPGDRMLAGLLDVAYPDHHTWGSIVPDAPWKVLDANGDIDVPATQAAYRRTLAGSGADPRRWEPMGSSTRWGESLDVVTDRAGLETLRHYETVVLVTSGPVGPALFADLEQYVRLGGTAVVNTRQLPPDADRLTGLHVTDERRRAEAVTWSTDPAIVSENPFDYTVVAPEEAEVVAATPAGDPLVTRHALGAGAVYVTTPDQLLDAEGRGVLTTGQRLLDELHAEVAAVTVDGPPLQYLVNKSGSRTIVTLINTDVRGSMWSGTLRFPAGQDTAAVREWTRDTQVDGSVEAGELVVDATVPPYGVRVYAFEPVG